MNAVGNSIDDAGNAQAKPLAFLLSPAAIRHRANQIYQRALHGETHFEVDESKLSEVADFVLNVIHENYPNGDVPYHSRWRHFEVGNRAQLKAYNTHCESMSAIDKARLGIELILPSVLIDAGAGPDWQYASQNSLTLGRSEGLALASLDMFLSSGLSHRTEIECSATGLELMSVPRFEHYFKVSSSNPLLGIKGRVLLLQQLGKAMRAKPESFPNARLGDFVDVIIQRFGKKPKATDILHLVLTLFGDIWPGRLSLEKQNLGDTWHYPPLGEGQNAFVPFHKLSQWISYSIIETLEKSGFDVTGINELTALAEYRNGGLILDSGLIRLRKAELATETWEPGSELIIEWRALTICLLEKLAEKIRQTLQVDTETFPLVKLLEGGTWSAGRKLAMQNRGNLTPPLNIKSDATVF